MELGEKIATLDEIAAGIEAEVMQLRAATGPLSQALTEAIFQMGQAQKALRIEHYPNALWVKELRNALEQVHRVAQHERHLALLAKMVRKHGEGN
jgi:DNA mismatch repair protein MutH